MVDMDTRFSVLYQRKGEQWRVVHLHQSMPNPEQEEGEYYPKTLTPAGPGGPGTWPST